MMTTIVVHRITGDAQVVAASRPPRTVHEIRCDTGCLKQLHHLPMTPERRGVQGCAATVVHRAQRGGLTY
jgi:hypothetical protein